MARREILVINPSRRRRRKKKKGRTAIRGKAKPMARKRKRSRRKTTYKAKRRYTRNPAKRRKRSTVRRATSRIFGGLNFRKAIGDMPAIQLGMFAATWSAKRWGSSATQTDPDSWTWDSYLKGAIGSVGAAMLANMMKPGSGQKVLEGGLNMMTNKAIQNELIAGSTWAAEQFGEAYSPDEYLMTGDENWFLGEDGRLYPTDEEYRLPEATYDGYGNALTPVGPMGDTIQPVTSLGSVVEEKARRAWFRAV